MTASVIYLGGLRTEATHIKSKNAIITDAPTDNRGKGESFSPTDMVAVALASCMLTIMGIKAADMDADISDATADVTKIMSNSGPRRISKIIVTINVPDRGFSDLDKSKLEKAAHGCPVRRSLHPDLEEDLTINWISSEALV